MANEDKVKDLLATGQKVDVNKFKVGNKHVESNAELIPRKPEVNELDSAIKVMEDKKAKNAKDSKDNGGGNGSKDKPKVDKPQDTSKGIKNPIPDTNTKIEDNIINTERFDFSNSKDVEAILNKLDRLNVNINRLTNKVETLYGRFINAFGRIRR